MTEPMTDDQLAGLLRAMTAEVERLRAENASLDDLRTRAIDKNDQIRADLRTAQARVAELEAAAAPKLCSCGHGWFVHTVPEPHSCFAVGQACSCPTYQQLPPVEAEEQLRKNIRAGEARRAAEQAAAIAAAGPLCTCRAFPAAHRPDLHDEHGQVVDIERVPSQGCDLLFHAKCTRCGWTSDQSWFAEDFTGSMAQNVIAGHRDRWTGRCAL